MGQEEGKNQINSEQGSADDEHDAPNKGQNDTPSAEQDIEPGVNQDKHDGETFSSEPPTEASGGADHE